MSNRTISILLLDDEYEEYENWIKWCNLIDWFPKIYYAIDIKEAIILMTNHKIDIYIIDIFLGKESGISFLELIKNKPGVKLAISNTVNPIEIEQIAESGAVLFNKQETQASSLKLVSTIKAMGELGKTPKEDYVLNKSDFNTLNIKIEKHQKILITISDKIEIITRDITDWKEYIDNIENIQKTIVGSLEKRGLKDRIETLEEKIEKPSSHGLAILIQYLIEESRKSPLLLMSILLILILSAISLPVLLIKSLVK